MAGFCFVRGFFEEAYLELGRGWVAFFLGLVFYVFFRCSGFLLYDLYLFFCLLCGLRLLLICF